MHTITHYTIPDVIASITMFGWYSIVESCRLESLRAINTLAKDTSRYSFRELKLYQKVVFVEMMLSVFLVIATLLDNGLASKCPCVCVCVCVCVCARACARVCVCVSNILT